MQPPLVNAATMSIVLGLVFTMIAPQSTYGGEPVSTITKFQIHLETLSRLNEQSVTGPVFDARPVVVTFFASWCGNCLQELKELRELSTDKKNDIEIIALNYFEDFGNYSNAQKLNAFLDDQALPFPVVQATDETSRLFGGITRIPSLFVFDAAGKLVLQFENTGPGKSFLTQKQIARAAFGNAAP